MKSTMFKKILVLMLVFAMVLPYSVFAAELPQDDETDVEPYADPILPGTIVDPGKPLTQIFSMTAKSVSSYLDTRGSGKSLNYDSLPSSSNVIYVKGKLSHTSYSSSKDMSIGLCVYSTNEGTSYNFDVAALYVKPDIDFTYELCSKSKIKSSGTCYGFIRNHAGKGKISGTYGFYYVK